MQRLPIRAMLAAAALLFSTHLAAAPAPTRADRVAQRAREAMQVLQGRRAAAATFGERFLAVVSARQLTALARRMEAENGKLLAVQDIRPTGPNTATFRFRFERATAAGTITIRAEPPYKVSAYWIRPVTPVNDSLERIRADFAALRGRSGFALIKLGDNGPETVAASRAEETFAIGSAFKLWVLDAVAEDIAAGRHAWDEVVRLGPRSLPSGQAQDWPPDAPVTVETLATLMISISDNTATDALIRLVGRERVAERVRANGHSDPSRMLPFLTTAEAFALKLSPPALRDDYARADDAGQQRILDGLDTQKVLAAFDPAAPNEGEPVAIETIEWFATAQDIARVLDSLRRRQDPRALQVLGVAPGMAKEWREGFAYLGYKGGSEVGVAHMTWLLRKPSGQWLVVTESWNDSKAPVDDERFKALGRRLVEQARKAR